MKMRNWMLDRWLAAALTATYAGLVLDLRYDHNHVIRHHAIAWTPIVYSAVMTVVGIAALLMWNRRGRMLLLWFSLAGIVVGLLGFWLHNGGHIFQRLAMMLSVWTGAHPDPTDHPPVLAPLAFAGLGALGILACVVPLNGARRDESA